MKKYGNIVLPITILGLKYVFEIEQTKHKLARRFIMQHFTLLHTIIISSGHTSLDFILKAKKVLN